MDFTAIAGQGITSLLLVTLILMLIRGDVVLGREYEQMHKDRDYWRDAAHRGLDLTETAMKPRSQRRSHDEID